ncbi:MAG: hypothetical protein K8T25_00860 [Planctomycetia bacterium]|nr:hypothetical protein [Planctomycetia bacterium]
MTKPLIQNYVPLIHGIINALLFLESAGPDEVDPDSAVRCMENIVSSLLVLEKSDQLALRSEFEKIAEIEQEPSYKKFVRGLPDMIGLASP